MLHVLWLHVKYTLNVVKNICVHTMYMHITKSDQITTKFVTKWT